MSTKELVLPWPPSVNHYWLLKRNGGRYISDAGRDFRNSVWAIARAKRCTTMNGRVAVSVRASPPDKRKRDLDNILKALLDALQYVGLINDDSNIDDLHIVREEPKRGGSVRVEIISLL